MFEINVEKILKITIIDVISKCDLNLMKMLFNVLIRKVKENVTFERC